MLDEPARVTSTYQRLIHASDDTWDAELKGLQTNQAQPAISADESHPLTNNDPQEVVIDLTEDPHPMLEKAWHDPAMLPKSTEIYPSHGAEIVDASFQLPDGSAANVLPHGTDFQVAVHYKATEPLDKLTFVCTLTNVTGQRITGQTYPTLIGGESSIASCEVGQEWNITFSFQGNLWPGMYFLICGILQDSDNGRTFIHRTIDYRALRVLEGAPQLQIGTCKMVLREPIATLGNKATEPEPAGT
jgi:lipopolysaccharide transport system ATP-binding protein